MRGDRIVTETSVASLRRFKDSVKEVATGMECGIRLAGVKDIQEGDLIELFTVEKVPQTL